MTDETCNKLLTAGIAVVFKYLVEHSLYLYMNAFPTGSPMQYTLAVGVLAMIIGSKLNIPCLGKGLFWGGALSIVLNHYNSWNTFGQSSQFWSCLVGFAVLTVIALRRAGKLGATKSRR
jgi:hypothetical protein